MASPASAVSSNSFPLIPVEQSETEQSDTESPVMGFYGTLLPHDGPDESQIGNLEYVAENEDERTAVSVYKLIFADLRGGFEPTTLEEHLFLMEYYFDAFAYRYEHEDKIDMGSFQRFVELMRNLDSPVDEASRIRICTVLAKMHKYIEEMPELIRIQFYIQLSTDELNEATDFQQIYQINRKIVEMMQFLQVVAKDEGRSPEERYEANAILESSRGNYLSARTESMEYLEQEISSQSRSQVELHIGVTVYKYLVDETAHLLEKARSEWSELQNVPQLKQEALEKLLEIESALKENEARRQKVEQFFERFLFIDKDSGRLHVFPDHPLSDWVLDQHRRKTSETRSNTALMEEFLYHDLANPKYVFDRVNHAYACRHLRLISKRVDASAMAIKRLIRILEYVGGKKFLSTQSLVWVVDITTLRFERMFHIHKGFSAGAYTDWKLALSHLHKKSPAAAKRWYAHRNRLLREMGWAPSILLEVQSLFQMQNQGLLTHEFIKDTQESVYALTGKLRHEPATAIDRDTAIRRDVFQMSSHVARLLE